MHILISCYSFRRIDAFIKSCKKFQPVCKTDCLKYLGCVNWYILLFLYLFGFLYYYFKEMLNLIICLYGDLCINTLKQLGNLVAFPVYVNCGPFFNMFFCQSSA
jgi:hypothetical protein